MSEHSAQGMAYPKGVSWDTPIAGGTLTDMLDESVTKFANRPALSFEGYKLNYRQFGKQVDLAARGLIDLGVRPGDRVGLFMPNTPYYPIMFFATLKAGATVVNFSSAYKDTPTKLEAQIKDSGAKIMVTMDLKPFFDSTRGMLDENLLQDIVVCPMSGALPFFKSLGFQFMAATSTLPKNLELASIDSDNDRIVSFDDLISFGKDDDPRFIPGIDKDQLAVIQYTSGTTGAPKGAMLTHSNFVSNIQQIDALFGWRKDRPQSPSLVVPGQEKFLAAIPFFHVYGLTIGLLKAVHSGAEIEILADPRNTEKVLKTIHDTKPTVFPTVPLMLSSIASHKNIGRYNLQSLKSVLSGGAALPPNVAKSFRAATGRTIYQGYGSTETSPLIASTPPPPGMDNPATVGIPCPQTDIRITDPENPDRVLPYGEKGEITVRGPQVMRGYWNNPDETRKVLSKFGRYRTGDIGFLDENGYLHITGREKRMMSINGFKVSPEMIEKGICEHPELAQIITECALVRVGIGTQKEFGLAVIRFKPEIKAPPEPKELRAMLEGHLTKQEMPREFRYVTDPLPKGDTGKPDWKKMEKDEAERRSSAPLHPSRWSEWECHPPTSA